jgi:hypothetical protein
VYRAENVPSVSRNFSLTFITDAWQGGAAPRWQCGHLHIVPNFWKHFFTENPGLSMVGTGLSGTRKAIMGQVWVLKLVKVVCDSFAVPLIEYISSSALL